MKTNSRVNLGYRTPDQRRAALLDAAIKRNRRAIRHAAIVWAGAAFLALLFWAAVIVGCFALLKWAIH